MYSGPKYSGSSLLQSCHNLFSCLSFSRILRTDYSNRVLFYTPLPIGFLRFEMINIFPISGRKDVEKEKDVSDLIHHHFVLGQCIR